MDWLVWITLIVLVVFQMVTWHKVDNLTEDLKVLRTRQSRVAQSVTTVRNPHVERARTSVRDTHDLPTTARMSIGRKRKVKRFDSTAYDS